MFMLNTLFPYQIVFLTPRSRFVKCQFVVIVVKCHLLPFYRQSFGGFDVFVRSCFFAQHTCHFSVSGDCMIALAERLALCARCPAKSSVQSWFQGPDRSQSDSLPMLIMFPSIWKHSWHCFIIEMAVVTMNHVSGFFDRHIFTIKLPVGYWISS